MVSNKHVVNDPRQLVNESLAGLARLNSKVKVDSEFRVVYRKEVPQDQVAIISGGGSGHEPAHAGFVGDGILTAAVCGNVFASPNVGQVRRAAELVKNNKGTLFVVKRYTGDVLLFGLAKEQSAVIDPKHPVRMTIVGDDVAVGRKQGALVGRRGLAGTVLVYKIAGALATEGAEIDEVHEIAEYVAERCGTIGSGLGHTHIPGTGAPEAHLTESEVEIGMGIHNEAGVAKVQLKSSKELVAQMLKMVTDTSDKDRAFVDFKHDGKDEVVLLINNLGGISELEISSIANDAVLELEKSNIKIQRIIIGAVMTSLNLPGFSLTTLLLPRKGDKYSPERILQLLDAQASAPGWKYMVAGPPGVPEAAKEASPPKPVTAGGNPVSHTDFALFEKSVTAGCQAVSDAEPEITRYDTIAGDGDCGLCLKAMADGIIKAFKAGQVDKQNVASAVLNIAAVIEKEGDGTSGALFNIWSNALAAGVTHAATEKNAKQADSAVWAGALDYALKALYQYTAARRPSRTLVDPLEAFTSAFVKSNGADFSAAVKAAVQAADETKDLVAKAGRAAYVGQDDLQKAQIPDPGAHGISKLLQGFNSVIA